MSRRPRWSYVQARLQARHGNRLDEVGWRPIEAAQSTDQFIERARASSLRRFTAHLHAHMSSHAIELMLRDEWRAYVGEVSKWMPAPWRRSVTWTWLLPELPIIDSLLKGEAPDWVLQDPAFAEFVEADPEKRNINPTNSPMNALLAEGRPEQTLAARWYAHWRSLWPRRHTDDRALLAIAATINAHVEQLNHAGLGETSAPYRRDLAVKLTHMFRRHSVSAAAVFCHLALVALDLERLRGNLIRRRLFERVTARETA